MLRLFEGAPFQQADLNVLSGNGVVGNALALTDETLLENLQVVHATLKSLRDLLPGPYLKDLQEAYQTYQRDGNLQAMLEAVDTLASGEENAPKQAESHARPLKA